jgi:hypothetical protein
MTQSIRDQSTSEAARRLGHTDSKESTTASITRLVHNSILGCTTEQKWDNAFEKTSADGSGFFQRLNIVSNPSLDRVPDLFDPDLILIRDRFVRKIQPLEYQKVVVQKTPEAFELLASWYKERSKRWQNFPEEFGRIQVLIHRNVSHLAWLMSGDNVVPDPDKAAKNEPIEVICDEDIMKRAIALADYQLFVRQMLRPITANNPWARLECAIRRYFVKNKVRWVTREKLSHDLHADRDGIQMFDKALNNLCQEGFIRVSKREGETKRGRKAQIITLVVD